MATFGAKRITPQKIAIVVVLVGAVALALWSMLGPKGLTTRGIDESKATVLEFNDLANCFDPKAPPRELAELDGQLVKIVGYMQPVYHSQRVRRFMLLPVSPRAKRNLAPNQIVVVSLEPRASVRLFDKPVEVVGEFHLGRERKPKGSAQAEQPTETAQEDTFFHILAFIVRPAEL